MDFTPPLHRLPSEINTLIMESLPSPMDLRSLVSASPVLLHNFCLYRGYILQPFCNLLRSKFFRDEYLLFQALLACRFRMIGRDFPHLAPQEAQKRVRPILFFYGKRSREWAENLPMICELYSLRQEADHVLAEYAVEAWEKLLYDAKPRKLPWSRPLLRWNLRFDQPLILSGGETYRLENSFLQFEIRRHFLHFDHTEILEPWVRWQMTQSIWSSIRTVLEGYKEVDWNKRAFQSMFRFAFDKYRRIIHRVEEGLDDPEPHCSSNLSPSHPDLNSIFHKRTLHEELRFAKSLCSQGHTLLLDLQRMPAAHLQHFILTSFHCFIMRESTATCEPKIRDQSGDLLNRSLMCLGGEDIAEDISGTEPGSWEWNISHENCHEPWTRGRYFWDRSRIVYLQSFINGNTRPSEVYSGGL